ncbi:putative motility protein [Tardiphaga sp. 768_D3_N2_1]|uniref:putative motility protein n=1 Tax=Tardiphaga sp. 768_D3_N2_1 TaxID=3240783 RepID=UPI003F887466
MDMALVASALAMQAAGTQQQISTSIMKSNADMEKNTVLTLLGGAQQASQANLGPGVGGNLDIAA